jgi:hypothetical protein
MENANEILEKAGIADSSYQDILLSILEKEIGLKEERAQERRLKFAGFPVIKQIEDL